MKEVVEELSADSETKKITLCNSGVMICKFNLLYSFIDKINNKNHKKEKYLPDLFKICYQNNKSFSYILCDENEMLGVNTLKDFNKIDAIYQKLLKNKLVENGVKIIDPDSVRISFDTKIASNVVIEPYVYFKTGVVIREGVIIKSHSVVESSIIGKGSVIGPYARIRPKTILKSNVKVGNFVEIKNSTIGDNSKISHLSYIGDSILGKNINIGAGTITCNFNGKIKNKTIIKDNVFVGSNTSLVAPITINANVTIGAGSVVTQNIPQNSLVLERSPLQIIKKKKKNP